MRKPGPWLCLILVLLLGLVALWAAGPWLAMRGIDQAIAARSPAQLEKHIDFPALRVNLKAQLADRLVRAAGAQSNRFGALALAGASSLVGASVDTLVTPAGLSAVLHGQGTWRKATGHTQSADTYAPPATPEPFAGVDWRYESLSRFSASRTDAAGPGHRTTFIFARQGLRWRLVDIQLPPGWAAADVLG